MLCNYGAVVGRTTYWRFQIIITTIASTAFIRGVGQLTKLTDYYPPPSMI
jgi:hypothetical protein